MLVQVAIFLAAAVLIVPLSKKFGLGTVLGYLIAGILVGPWGLGLITNVENILNFAELGVVFLLFIIGLELQPSRLWLLRRPVFGLGSLQMACSALLITLVAYSYVQDWITSLIIGLAMAMSSTAFILQTLVERKELSTRYGRDSFAILLFQDIAVIPMLAIISLIGISPESITGKHTLTEVLLAVAVIIVMVTVGRTVLRILFRGVAYFGNREIFTAAALLVVLGTAMLMHLVGLTMSLGAFIAGVLLSDSEFRHQITAEIEPFRGLLVGLFFIAIGMSVNLGLIGEIPTLLIGLTIALIITKFLVMLLITRLLGYNNDNSRNVSVLLAAGGEFAFLLFTLAGKVQVIDNNIVEILVVIITLSMITSPILILLNDKIPGRILEKETEPDYDQIEEAGNPVVIIGFGRVGQIISRILHMCGISFTALENDPSQVDFVRKFGGEINYGDATRIDLLHAAKIEQARLIVLSINDIEASMKVAVMLRENYPQIPIYARAYNRLHCYKLLDLGIKVLHRDTFYSSLKLSTEILIGLGFSREDAEQTVDTFRKHDEELLLRQHSIYQDEAALIESVVKSRIELHSLFEEDIAAKKSAMQDKED